VVRLACSSLRRSVRAGTDEAKKAKERDDDAFLESRRCETKRSLLTDLFDVTSALNDAEGYYRLQGGLARYRWRCRPRTTAADAFSSSRNRLVKPGDVIEEFDPLVEVMCVSTSLPATTR
jgi:hypothetical protein